MPIHENRTVKRWSSNEKGQKNENRFNHIFFLSLAPLKFEYGIEIQHAKKLQWILWVAMSWFDGDAYRIPAHGAAIACTVANHLENQWLSNQKKKWFESNGSWVRNLFNGFVGLSSMLQLISFSPMWSRGGAVNRSRKCVEFSLEIFIFREKIILFLFIEGKTKRPRTVSYRFVSGDGGMKPETER